MHWSSLPLIEMDEVSMRTNSDSKSRSQHRNLGDSLEKDITKQLSALREQSRISRDDGGDGKPGVDSFGRDVRRKAPSRGEPGPEQNLDNRERSRRRDRSRSPRRWRHDDFDRGNDYGRGRDWDRDEPRRRGRDNDGYRSDGSVDSWEGGRSGERYRDRPRSRDSDRYRDRRDWDSRDRDERDWRRDKRDDRDDDRRRDYRDRYGNDDERYWSEHRSRDRYHDDRDHHRREYREEPSEIVMLKGLPTSVEDAQIHEVLGDAKLPYKDVRVVKTREGLSRGFAFVEFLDVETAKRWIDDCKGKLLMDEVSVMMDFSRSKMSVDSHRDWVCSKCGTQNFSSKRRNTCFSCNAPKDENDEAKELGTTPCKVLILRGLDVLTTEETVRQSLASFTSTPIFDVRLIKDKLTGTSRGFCFVELGSIEEASTLMEELQNTAFKIDEKAVAVSYAKFGSQPSKQSAGTSGNNSSSTTEASALANDTSSSTSSSASHSRSNNFAANAIAQARAAAQMGNTTDRSTSQIPGSLEQFSSQADVLASQAVLGATYGSSGTATSSSAPSSSAATDENSAQISAAPRQPQTLSSYVYDAATGYYYDTSTGLYYDPNTQYYYNSATQQYMYWDATSQQYVAVVSSSSDTTAATVSEDAENVSANKEKQKKAKSLNAKKIAKDMERWAKKQAKSKDSTRAQAPPQAVQDPVKESSYQYDPNDLRKSGIKMTIASSGNMPSLALTASPLAALSDLESTEAPPPAAASSLVAEYGGDDSGGEEDSRSEDHFTDWTKMACLLCKRQFPSKEALTRHNQLSDLHKQNLEIQKKLKMSFAEIDVYERSQREAKYRDRARERRELFGQPDSAPPGSRKRRKGKIAYDQPTKDGITSENIGNKMLQAMGWTAGTGLGKDRQGIVDPILAKMRNRTAGLGLKGSDYGATSGDSERDILKKMAQSRYDSFE